jgi:hypothetical protein
VAPRPRHPRFARNIALVRSPSRAQVHGRSASTAAGSPRKPGEGRRAGLHPPGSRRSTACQRAVDRRRRRCTRQITGAKPPASRPVQKTAHRHATDRPPRTPRRGVGIFRILFDWISSAQRLRDRRRRAASVPHARQWTSSADAGRPGSYSVGTTASAPCASAQGPDRYAGTQLARCATCRLRHPGAAALDKLKARRSRRGTT